MTKAEFLSELQQALCALPQSEIIKSLDYYEEIINDRMEEGISEEQAVGALGKTDAIARELLLDMGLLQLMKAKVKPNHRLKGWEIILLIAGSPVWAPLVLAFLAIVLAVYMTIWAVLISLWAAAAAIAVTGIMGLAASAFIFAQNPLSGLMVIGGAITCCGLAVFAFLGMRKLSVYLIRLTALFIRGVKSIFIQKGGRKNA